jgi:hypothetical protein
MYLHSPSIPASSLQGYGGEKGLHEEQLSILERKVFDGRIKHLKREYPQLETVLDQPPCERCCELWSCHNSEECPKLTAWLIAVTGEN